MSHAELPSFGSIKADLTWKVAIIHSIWHAECTDAMVAGAREELIKHGIDPKNILDVPSPGSFELPLLSKQAIEGKDVNGVIAFGVIVQGQTHHARLIAEEAARGIMQLQLEKNVPITFEVLFVDNIEDARARSIGPNSKGPLAAQTLLHSLARQAELQGK
jgi:6,7-dimethyl-8-ribityllumazine synthase